MKIKINGNNYVFFNDFTFTQNLDSVASSFSFTAKFDPENNVQKSFFRPLSFCKVEFFEDSGELFFTGVIVSHTFPSSAVSELVTLSGYSLSGVIEDCTIPYSAYPLESNNRSLKEITERFIKPFGLKLIVESSAKNDSNIVYSVTAAQPQDKVKEYISKLSAQRNVVLTHNEKGNLVFFKPDFKGKPKVSYNSENTTAMSLEVNGQETHSELTILRQPEKRKTEKKKKKQKEEEGVDANGYPIESDPTPPSSPTPKKPKQKPLYYDTIKNPLVLAYRPIVDVLTQGDATATKNGAKNFLADELKNIKFGIELNRWDNLRAGDIVEIENAKLFIKGKVKLVVETLTKNENSDQKTMSINLVLPECFTGNAPKNIFLW